MAHQSLVLNASCWKVSFVRLIGPIIRILDGKAAPPVRISSKSPAAKTSTHRPRRSRSRRRSPHRSQHRRQAKVLYHVNAPLHTIPKVAEHLHQIVADLQLVVQILPVVIEPRILLVAAELRHLGAWIPHLFLLLMPMTPGASGMKNSQQLADLDLHLVLLQPPLHLCPWDQ